jgi:hypothetical protein
MSGEPRLRTVLWFQIRDHPGGSQYYGLPHADGSPKPSFAAFQAVPS